MACDVNPAAGQIELVRDADPGATAECVIPRDRIIARAFDDRRLIICEVTGEVSFVPRRLFVERNGVAGRAGQEE